MRHQSSHQFLLDGSCSEVVALFPNPIPIEAATIATCAITIKIQPGNIIAIASSPAETYPTIRSGKPILNKIMPITNVIFHCVMNLDRTWKLQCDYSLACERYRSQKVSVIHIVVEGFPLQLHSISSFTLSNTESKDFPFNSLCSRKTAK